MGGDRRSHLIPNKQGKCRLRSVQPETARNLMPSRFNRWLKTRAIAQRSRNGIAPAYSGWLLGGLSIFFFAAATNTLAGWLYVISGVMLAIVGIGALLPARSIRNLQISRQAIDPISAGEECAIELLLKNPTAQPKSLLQVRDNLPVELAKPSSGAIELIPAQSEFSWQYRLQPDQRGIYRWETIELRTAAPLGLFWARRTFSLPAKLVVYPTVLPLARCPLLDRIGRESSLQIQGDIHAQGASEGVTRTLRPYRWGDPTRLVHWRTSARYGELRVRELETFTSTQAIAIALDLAAAWRSEDFEQAVIAAASLYFYALRQQRPVSLWTGATGSVRGQQAVLETLAAIVLSQIVVERSPDVPLVWLSANPASLSQLPIGSGWFLWGTQPGTVEAIGRVIDRNEPLLLELQRS